MIQEPLPLFQGGVGSRWWMQEQRSLMEAYRARQTRQRNCNHQRKIVRGKNVVVINSKPCPICGATI